MSPQAQALGHYGALEGAYAEMLEAARRGDWDAAAEAERACRPCVEALRALGEVPLDAAGRRLRFARLQRLLAADAAIRALAGPWMGRLQELLGDAGRARRLRQSYGSAP